jgi:hypothetical protein
LLDFPKGYMTVIITYVSKRCNLEVSEDLRR